MNKRLLLTITSVVVILLICFGFLFRKQIKTTVIKTVSEETQEAAKDVEETAIKPAIPATPEEIQQAPADKTALGGYNVLIADRGNNRIIEVTPDKNIVWQYDFHLPSLGLGADDAFFTNDGKDIISNLEDYHTIQLIEYSTKKVLWEYGVPGKPGSADGSLNTPDDAYKLPNGDVIVADIKNCRVIEISPDKKIVHQYGETKKCGNTPGLLNKPNGDTPLKNGHILISNIVGHSLLELDQNWQPVFSMNLPVRYPSDPQPTKAGNILISDYSHPGQVLEVARDGTVVWAFNDKTGAKSLDNPSLAVELPNGNIMVNDDDHQRVIVINKQTKEIVWQYGVMGKPGNGPGQLSDPDGMDYIMRTPSTSETIAPQTNLTLSTVGSVTRHAAGFIGKIVNLNGVLLKSEGNYVIISDESTGAISSFDLPVIGTGISQIVPGTHYQFTGTFVKGGLTSSNHSAYHLELTQPPELIPTTTK